MAFSGGTFSRTFDCTTDRDNGVKILASKFDTELDGFATGLSTCILKDGTQTCTAAIPFAEGLTVPDNKTIILGTNSDITIQYDESTNDSLEIAANVEGAALGIVLKADQGDDNADQHKLNIADGGVLTLGSKISGSFVSYLTHTPNSTVASSTTAVAGNLTVGGDLTLGSGAVISEAELEAIDGVTAGTVAASKAVIVDSNKDIASFRNVTLTGELDAGSLDISGDADIDGTLEADAMTLNGTAITATATLDTGISNNNVPKFTSGVADDDFLRVAGTAIEGRSASEVLSDIGGQASLTFGISNTNAVKIDSSSVADDEYARFTASGLESRSNAEVLSDIGALPLAGGSMTGAVTITTADNTAQLTLKSTDADDSSGPRLDLTRDSGSPADGDTIGRIRYLFDNDAAEQIEGVRVNGIILDASDGTEDCQFEISTRVDGDIRSRIKLGTETVFNEASQDIDFRVESNGNANMLFVDAGNDCIGISNNIPGSFNAGANNLVVGSGSGSEGVTIYGGAESNIFFADGTATADNLTGRIEYSHSSDSMSIYTNNAFAARVDSSGNLNVNQSSSTGGKLNVSNASGTWAATLVDAVENGNYVEFRDSSGNQHGYLKAEGAGLALNVGSAGGIDFSANANVSGMTSELLDDYEEGTFTPSFTGGITGSSYGDQNGTYVKIGQLVFFAIELDITNGQQSTNGNQIKIDNIPFVSAAASPMVHSQGGAWVTFNNNFYNVDTGPYFQIPTNTNQIKLYRGSGNALAGNDTGVNAQNDLHIAGCYRTA